MLPVALPWNWMPHFFWIDAWGLIIQGGEDDQRRWLADHYSWSLPKVSKFSTSHSANWPIAGVHSLNLLAARAIMNAA